MKKLLCGLSGLLWFGLVFVVSFFFTFPDDDAALWARWQVQEQTDGAYELSLSSLSLHGLGGVRGQDVTFYEVEKRRARRGDEKENSEKKELFSADRVQGRVGLLSALRGRPSFDGSVRLGAADIDISGILEQVEDQFQVRKITIKADALPLESFPAISGTRMLGTGTIDLEIDLSAPEGLSKANGKIVVSGRDLEVTLSSPGNFLDGFGPFHISEIEIRIDVTEGKARVTDGRLVSDQFEIEIDGEVALQDEITRSSVKMGLVVAQLGEQFQPFQGFLRDAKWDNDTYHYSLRGTLGRLGAPRPEREKRATTRRTPRDRGLEGEDEGGGVARPGRPDRPPLDRGQRDRDHRRPGDRVQKKPIPIDDEEFEDDDEEEEFDDEELEDDEPPGEEFFDE